jgi:23S rRNA pseudouridine1911/1915/1917 synthase
VPELVRSLTVEPAAAGGRLDRWLARQLPEQSRSRLQSLIEAGAILLDGGPARPSSRVRAGQTVSVRIPEPRPATLRAEDIPLAIVHEDDRLLVIEKPAGLVVHPGAGVAAGTLVNALLHHVRDLSGIGGELRPGIVHRLDKGTSGLMVVAKDDAAHRDLVRQFAGRTVEKDYLAVVLGVPSRRQGSVDAPIGRDPVNRKKMSARARRARAARSDYAVVEVLDGAALVRVRIHTGRTHQVRVHLAWLGHPVAGDSLYGGRRLPGAAHAAARDALRALERPALHAARLAFDHPGTRRRLAFESPLPADLEALCSRLRPGAGPAGLDK